MESRPPPHKSDLALLRSKHELLRDDLIQLLHMAAQIEHDLMVQYLYAAYSLGGEPADRHPDLVRACRDTLLVVAREEMGHLLTVQNILLLVGGPVHLERPAWSAESTPFDVRLERFSIASLAKYLHIEAPIGFINDKRHQLLKECLIGREKELELGGLVGWIYGWLIATFQDTERIPDSTFDPATEPYQATWDEFARGYGRQNAKPYALKSDMSGEEHKGRVLVATVTTRAQVISALRDIAGQGEVPEKENRPNPLFSPAEGPSHFDRFRDLFDQFHPIWKEDPKWSPSRPVVDNPWLGKSGNRPNRTMIPWGTAQHWAELFNVRYRMLLSLMTYLFRIPRDGSASGGAGRAQILGRMFGEMYNMKAVAGILVRLPLEDGKDDSKMAGPPFETPYTLEQPVSKASFWRTHLDLLDQAADLTKFLLTDDYLGRAPAEGERYLRLTQAADLQAREWVAKILTGDGDLP